MPGLPRVALQEVEALGVGGQPAVGGRAGRGRARCRGGAATGPAAPPTSGSGCAAKSRACSASLRKADVMSSATPSARAAAAMRSKASATSGRIGLPWRSANGPRYSPAVSAPASGSVPGGASSASAVAALGTVGPVAHDDRVAHRHAHADRRQPAAGEGDADVARAVARGGRARRVLAEREVLGALEVARVVDAVEDGRLEDARVGVVHGAGGGQRRQVGGALQLPAHADPARDPAQHDRAEHDRHEQPERAPSPPGPSSPRRAPHATSSRTAAEMAARRAHAGERQRALHAGRARA